MINNVSLALQTTTIPPLIDVPTFSLSTLGPKKNDNLTSQLNSKDVSAKKSTMNILTYASPISIKPHRMWSVSLYKGTLSHENFARERRGVLQLLSPAHAARGDPEAGELIRLLGGCSGRDVDKEMRCADLGFEWTSLECENDATNMDCDRTDWPKVLPSCLYYLKLELVGDLIDCGSHEVALCRVVSIISDDEVQSASEELNYISTRKLRNMGIISELGRVVE